MNQFYTKDHKDKPMNIRSMVLLLLVIVGSAIAVEKLGVKEPTPRQLPDGRKYRQWCCPHCSEWNSGYGPPYTCKRCGYKMNW